ncbi:MAG: hypothetical protein UHM85_05995 [Acutalibacteraceae bacterium]|nr:hypothetical protein [Acutalibacteraceae bacterium]
MKVIKFITVLIAVVVLLSTSILPVGASSDDTILYGMTHDDMLQYGYLYEDGIYMLPSGIIPPEAYFPSTMVVSDPKYPNFDPRKLPWIDAPNAVQDIITMGIEGAATTDVNSYKMPFICIRVNSSGVTVYAGLNCFLGYANSSGNLRVCFVKPGTSVRIPNNSYCYTATFSQSYKVKSDWRKCEYSFWGDSDSVYTYSSSTLIASSYNVDLYLYGGNAFVGNFTSATVGSGKGISFPVDNNLGFTSGRFITNPSEFTELYVSSFTPPTPEEYDRETQKGILDTLKSIPDKIGGFFENLKNYLLYFQAEKPEHVNPFAGILTDVQNFFNSQIEDTSDFKDSLNSTFENVSTYISTGSSVINKLLDGVPLLNAFLIFFVVIAVIRKVVGR